MTDLSLFGRPIERILCPVDLSETSRHAIGHAVALARSCSATLTALHVHEPMYMPVPGLPAVDDRIQPAELERLHAAIRAAFDDAGADGLVVERHIDVGRPIDRILERAATLPAQLIVMGTHGASGFEHLLLGSVTEKVLRKASCPVLTVPPRAQATSRLPFEHVVCGVDFSVWSLAALQLACALARGGAGHVTMVHVIEWPWPEPPPPNLSELPVEQAKALADYRRHREETALAQLNATAATTAAAGSIKTPRVMHGKPHVEILRVAAEEHADVIMMGVHGRSMADVVVFGSTTNQVVRHATCPVLSVRR